MLSGSFGFSLTISVSAVPENLLRTSAEVVVSTGLVTFATFELVLTGFKNFLQTLSSTGVFTTI